MAKNVRVSDELYTLVQAESALEDRSIAQQLERWAKLGMAAEAGRSVAAVSSVEAALAMTRRLDMLDVESGRRRPESLHFIPRDLALRGEPRFPGKYRKG